VCSEFSVSVLRCSFHIINWRLEEIRKIARKTPKVLTIYKMHHPKADIDKTICEKERWMKRPVTN
jgi:hypothetical protein